MAEPKVNDEGETMVWSILDNCYVTLPYWRWVNGLD